MRNKEHTLYVLVVLGRETLEGDLEDCLITSCTNKNKLSELSGIKYDRLVYLLTTKKKKVFIEGGNLIIKIENTYKGRQRLTVRHNGYSGFNRNI